MKSEGKKPFPRQVLTGDQVRKIFGKTDPEYGKDFSEREWEHIALRLVALTRLICRIHARITKER